MGKPNDKEKPSDQKMIDIFKHFCGLMDKNDIDWDIAVQKTAKKFKFTEKSIETYIYQGRKLNQK